MSTEGMSTEGSGAGSTVDLDEALRIVKSFPDQIEMLMSENAQLRTDLEAARAEIAEAHRQLFKWPVTYGNASEFTLAAMVVEAQHEMAQRTLALNETRAEIERLHTEGAEVSRYVHRS